MGRPPRFRGSHTGLLSHGWRQLRAWPARRASERLARNVHGDIVRVRPLRGTCRKCVRVWWNDEHWEVSGDRLQRATFHYANLHRPGRR